MKRTFAKILCLVLAIAMLVPCFASCGNKNYAKENTKVKIGISGPLTGGAAVYGIAVRNAAQLAVNEINAKAKDELGFEFEFVMLDDKHDKDNFESLFSIIETDIIILISQSCSDGLMR